VGFTGTIASDRAILASLLTRLGLPAGLISPLLAHARAVSSEADRLGLVAPGDARHVVPRHTADSLLFALARPPKAGERWVDVGSGAGFPGLVLACCYSDAAFTLVEPLQKRAGFLELAAGNLGLANVVVEARTLERAGLGGFDVAVARALSGPVESARRLLDVVRVGGAAIVAIGSNAELDAPGELVRVADLGNVDSPGLFSMMTREA
jgi:16S rRNA (guanine527-N7)-methyltransferase